MDAPVRPARPTWLGTLRRFSRETPAASPCELCSAGLTVRHQHLVELATRQLRCCCDACAILFDRQGDLKYRRVPRRIEALSDFRLTDFQWDSLLIPINMAFFYRSSVADRIVAMYPGPAGAAESLLDLEAWEELAEENPILRELEPDVEALLVNRVDAVHEYYRVPIDRCYTLVGVIRAHWRGLSGGAAAWREIRAFFARLGDEARPARGRSHG